MKKHLTLALLLLLSLCHPLFADPVHLPDSLSSDTLKLAGPLPDPLLRPDGSRIESVGEWRSGARAAQLELFRRHVYGRVPERDLQVSHRVVYLDRDALWGSAVQKEVDFELSCAGKSMRFRVLMMLPKESEGPVPVFLGLNFYGNQSTHPDPSISISEAWCRDNPDFGVVNNRATIASRGVRSERWPVDMILDRGYGLATLYYGDIDPDFDDDFVNGVHGLMDGAARDGDAWGSISAWAWGLSRVMDYLETDADVDASRVALIGHSRLGKTALWAGAQDERFAMVVSNNSGCGGAALSRRAHGERIEGINEVFPHWFARNFHAYGGREEALPVDQHMLLGLIAPRPLYVASAAEDDWADPYGEYLSLYYGSSVYGLYGHPVLSSMEHPPVDHPIRKGPLAYHVRSGKHDLTRYDWAQYLSFADRHLKPVVHGRGNEEMNPVSLEWLKARIPAGRPRLILSPEAEDALRQGFAGNDLLLEPGCDLLRQRADAVLELPPLKRTMEGRRLLGVSREAIGRLSSLALVYRIDRNRAHLQRLEEELRAVCGFSDWNPSHFLDVAEMAAGVALALDWAGEWLSPELYKQCLDALVRHALKPGVAAAGHNWWTTTDNNWNLVCNGGLSLAALLAFDAEPELCSRILHQAVESIPLALEPYGPDGIYPEGPSYWFYASTYLALGISAFESALGTDFGFPDMPGVRESALFSEVLAGPSGDYYNFFDASLNGYHSITHFGLLSWFASRSGTGIDPAACKAAFEDNRAAVERPADTRFLAFHLLNIAGVQKTGEPNLPAAWVAGGNEPMAVFRDPGPSADGFFFAAKGGRAADNHGNMDAGSFILEMDGVRWSVDPGNQHYHTLEQLMGMELWSDAQESGRWTLLTKGSHGHSTLTVNGEAHRVDARSGLLGFDLRSPRSEVHFTMDGILAPHLKMATRSFSRLSDRFILVRDRFSFAPSADSLQWQMMTTAEVEMWPDRLVLKQDGRELFIYPLSAVPCQAEVISLSPPPLEYDKNIEGLKRIVFHFRRADFVGSEGEILIGIGER